MKRSDQIDQIADALAQAQAEMRNPAFDSSNPHFKNRFASLAAVRNAAVPVLSKHGISLMQELTSDERGVGCLTILSHKSGQWMEFGPLSMPVGKNDAQGFGSASTYCKRYSLMAVCGVVGDEDDDAEQAVGRDQPSAPVTRIDTKLVNKYSKAIIDAVGAEKHDALAELLAEIKTDDQEFRAAVWATLPMPIKNHIKDHHPKAA